MRLKERIKFVLPSTKADTSAGTKLAIWDDIYECWADVVQGSGGNLRAASNREFQSFQLANMVTVEIKLRQPRHLVITTEYSIFWRGYLLTIQGQPDFREKNFVNLVAVFDPKNKGVEI